MKTLMLLMLIAANASGAAIFDPLKYSERLAEEYSKGDSGKIGIYECEYNHAEESEIGGNIRIVDCEGQTLVLVHGGYMARVSFDCRTTFEPMPYGRGYQVNYQSCH